MLNVSKSKKRRSPSLKKMSKKRMSQPMVTKQLLNKLKKISEMILPLYIKELKMLYPKKKVNKSFAIRYSLNFLKKALKQTNLKQLKGGSNGAWVKPVYKSAAEYRLNEDLYGDNRLNSNNELTFRDTNHRVSVTWDRRGHWKRSSSDTTQHAKDNFDLVSYMAIGLGFFMIMAKLLFY